MCHAGNICALCSPGITLFAEVMYLDTACPRKFAGNFQCQVREERYNPLSAHKCK